MYVPNSTSSAYQLDMYVERKVDKKAELEKKKAQRIKMRKRKMTLYLSVFLIALFVIIVRNVAINDLHSDITAQTKKLEDLRVENEQMRLNIENMTDKTKIREYAENQLGLKKITSAQTVYLNPAKGSYMQNVADNGSEISGIKGFFAGFLEYLK